jgi:hypothetical protein
LCNLPHQGMFTASAADYQNFHIRTSMIIVFRAFAMDEQI